MQALSFPAPAGASVFKSAAKAVGISGFLLILVACQEGQTTDRAGFKAKYQVARNALEEGSYARAGRNYKALLAQAGPLEPRVRLEYAHSLLRNDQFEAAAAEAGKVANSQTGNARLAALAVRGTADHELARAAIANGQRDAAVRARLQAAASALDAVLKHAKTFDPVGSLATRRKQIAADLAAL